MVKKETVIAVVGVGAIGVAAYALTRSRVSQRQQQTASAVGGAFSSWSGGGATGGYSEPTVSQTVSSVLESVLGQTTQSPALPEMLGEMNPSDEAADVAQSSAISQDVQRVFARSGSITQTLTDSGYALPSQSQSGAAATLMAASKAVEYEETREGSAA